MTFPRCPICGAAMESDGRDRLDQSLWTFLPAVRFRCMSPACAGDTTTTIATGAHWDSYPGAGPDHRQEEAGHAG